MSFTESHNRRTDENYIYLIMAGLMRIEELEREVKEKGIGCIYKTAMIGSERSE